MNVISHDIPSLDLFYIKWGKTKINPPTIDDKYDFFINFSDASDCEPNIALDCNDVFLSFTKKNVLWNSSSPKALRMKMGGKTHYISQRIPEITT